MLQNSRNAREKPLYFVCDEQLSPYFGHLSGLKKRLPKKKIEGIEYFTLATSRDNEGWSREELSAKLFDGDWTTSVCEPPSPSPASSQPLHHL